MKFVLGLFAVGSLLVIRGDGVARPPRPDFIPWALPSEFPTVPMPSGFRIWAALWGDGWGEVRRQLTAPASPRLEAVYREVLERADPWKFDFRPPVLYETQPFVPLFVPNPPALFYARYFQGPNRILVDGIQAARMTDAELRVLLSHELGHAIDAQSERVGHWSFRDVYWMDEQQFADHVARLLTSSEEVKAFNEKYIHPKFPTLR